MIYILIFTCAHFVLCLLFFTVIQRPLFYFYNKRLCADSRSCDDLTAVSRHGFTTDCIAASYLTMIPVLAVWVSSYVSGADISTVLAVCDAVIAVTVGLAVIADTVLYRFWQFKLDSSVFSYLKHLDGAFASVSCKFVALALVSVAAMSVMLFVVLLPARLVLPQDVLGNDACAMAVAGRTGLFLLMSACLFAVVRGIHHRPNNPCVAYYSHNPFNNHAALNPVYSLVYSLSIRNDYEGKFRFVSDEECAKEIRRLYPTKGTPQVCLLNTTRPNILFIIWESLAARFLSNLGGEGGVMPNVERLSDEGVLFTKCDAGSFRTERGLVCLLSGWPGQPTANLIRHTRKLPNIPALPRRLRDEGYETMALHGGNCRIMNKTDYYLTAGHTTLVSQDDLPRDAPRCAWGINDGYTFDWLYDDIMRKTQRGALWYTTYQTLSSHEPFDVPFHKLADEKKNSFAYVDDCFGRFIDRLKNSPAWDNLLIICTGDHGFNFCSPISRDKFPHIPVLMLGGAVRRPVKIDKIICQTDVVATLLGQMKLPHDEFLFSRDVLADTYTYPFSLHTYNNGFLFRDGTGYTDYDNNAEAAVTGHDRHRERNGKIILQALYADLARR